MSELRDNISEIDIEKLNQAYLNRTNIDDLNGSVFFFNEKLTNKIQFFFFKGFHLNHEPFTFCSISNLLNDMKFIENLKNELSKVKYEEKNNDLYKFKQVNGFFNT